MLRFYLSYVQNREIGIMNRLSAVQIAKIVFGCLLFGAVMALRDGVANIWIRAVIAAAAGAALMIVLKQAFRN